MVLLRHRSKAATTSDRSAVDCSGTGRGARWGALLLRRFFFGMPSPCWARAHRATGVVILCIVGRWGGPEPQVVALTSRRAGEVTSAAPILGVLISPVR